MEIPPSVSHDRKEDRALPVAQTLLLLILLLGYPLFSIGFDLAGAISTDEISSRTIQIYLPTLAIQLAIIFSLWVVMRRTGSGFSELGLGRSDMKSSNIVAGLIFFVGAWLIMIILKSALSESGYVSDENLINILPTSAGERILWFFLAAGAALSEEIAFRGYVISRVRKITGTYWMGAVLGSVAFSTGHLYQGIAGVLLIFIYGMLFSGLYIARKSVLPCIVAHFLQDLTVLLAPLILPHSV